MPSLTAEDGIVAAGEKPAAMIGLKVLKNGGNAFDAAVSTALAISVVDPGDSGLGGGGFAAIYDSSQDEFLVVDFNSVCPELVSDSTYELLPSRSEYSGFTAVKNDENIYGYKSISVPGTAAGYELILEKYGTKKFSELVQPSIDLARRGHPMSRFVADYTDGKSELVSRYGETNRIFLSSGSIEEGQRLRLPDYAKTLELLQREGLGCFYTGSLAEKIVEAMGENGGLVTAEDLEAYSGKVVEPLSMNYRGYDVHVAPVGSGGPAVLQILGILQNFELGKMKHYSAEAVHLMIESMKLVWADRLKFDADPDYTETPMAEMLSESYCRNRAAEISPGSVIQSAQPGNPWRYSKPGGVREGKSRAGSADHTTHLTVVDGKRNFVALTQTLWGIFGSLVTIPGTGIVMNNGQSRFDPEPKSANKPEPRKRVLANMCPLIASRGGRPVLAAGTPGSKRVVTTMALSLINTMDYHADSESIDMPRFHVERGEPVLVEPLWLRMPVGSARRLEKLGHRLVMVQVGGGTIAGYPYVSGPASMIMVKDGALKGTADSRQPGAIVGY